MVFKKKKKYRCTLYWYTVSMIGYLSMFGYLFLKQLCVTGLCRDGALFAFFQPCSPEAG